MKYQKVTPGGSDDGLLRARITFQCQDQPGHQGFLTLGIAEPIPIALFPHLVRHLEETFHLLTR